MVWRGTGSSVRTRNERTGQANPLSMDFEQCRPRTAVASKVHFGRRGHWAHRVSYHTLSCMCLLLYTIATLVYPSDLHDKNERLA
jgi:hypothetical protein